MSFEKLPLVGLNRDEIAETLQLVGIPIRHIQMRVRQLWHWLYVRGASSFDDMFNLSKELREKFSEDFSITRPKIMTDRISKDGTRKWLLRFSTRGNAFPVEIETVYIPEKERGTLCISSQVGCSLTCSFCHTGTQRLVRNLTAEEILLQLLVARECLGDFPGRNIPDNAIVQAIKKALLIISDGEGLSLSKRRITLSTSGVVPGMYRTGKEIGVMLAISLHATDDALRNRLVPINKKYPLAELMDACRNYPVLRHRITFEYVMLKDINDSADHARKLVDLLKGIPAKINLIPFNPWPGTNYQCSDRQRIEQFAAIVNTAGYASPIRTTRGNDILAACGQLKSLSRSASKKMSD